MGSSKSSHSYAREIQKQITYKKLCHLGIIAAFTVASFLWLMSAFVIIEPAHILWLNELLSLVGVIIALFGVFLWSEHKRANEAVNHLAHLNYDAKHSAVGEES